MKDVRKGVAITLEGEPYIVTSSSFMKKQQRRPVMRCVLRNLRTGNTREHTFMQSDKIEEADIGRSHCQFLYKEGEAYMFMDHSTYEQVLVDPDIAGGAALFLLEGQDVQLLMYDGKPVAVELPIKIDREVKEAPPGVRGDTSTNVMKDVVVEGDVTVKAPLFIQTGDKIRIDTRTGEYAERA